MFDFYPSTVTALSFCCVLYAGAAGGFPAIRKINHAKKKKYKDILYQYKK